MKTKDIGRNEEGFLQGAVNIPKTQTKGTQGQRRKVDVSDSTKPTFLNECANYGLA